MLLLAQPRCIAAGCSPRVRSRRHHHHHHPMGVHAYIECVFVCLVAQVPSKRQQNRNGT